MAVRSQAAQARVRRFLQRPSRPGPHPVQHQPALRTAAEILRVDHRVDGSSQRLITLPATAMGEFPQVVLQGFVRRKIHLD
jgi:hypothetical protein